MHQKLDFVNLTVNNMTQEELYDQDYLDNTILLLKYEVKDLHKWSVYNNDKLNEKLAELDDLILEIEEEAKSEV